ncbi:chemotaxis protein [Actinoplanes sp. NBRC 14428]|nr:chemotaxis protein [Actinoplanes sp. NBRC 14428]
MRKINASIAVKLMAVALVAVLGVLVLAFVRIADIRPTEMEAREVKMRQLVEAAHSVLGSYQKLEADGTLTRIQAQDAAKATIKNMRYDKVEYFWINDMHPRMVMHPTSPALDGEDLSMNEDPNGKLLFVEMVKVVRADGAGSVSYLWPKPDHKDPVPKLSYVAGFAPWEWIIGSGIYIDDVDAIVATKRNQVLLQTGVVLVLLLAGLAAVSLSISRPVRRMTGTLDRLAAGDLDVPVPPAGRDELGRMAASVRTLQRNLRTKQELEQQAAGLQEQAAADQRRATADLAQRVESVVRTVLDRITEAVTSMQETAADLTTTTGDLSTAVDRISGQAAESTGTAAQAAQEANQVSDTVTGLTSAAETIGGVIEVIRSVAAQTNLLALNATIEAARAGDMGKGFAVVANEVKELAQQSAAATDQIASEVEAIQATSNDAASVMARMAETVRSLGSATDDVAVAIAGGDGARSSVRETAFRTGQVAVRIQQASDQLAREADRVSTEFAALIEQMTEGHR